MAQSKPTGFLSLVEAGNSCPADLLTGDHLYKLYFPYNDEPQGVLRPAVVQKMPWTSSFKVSHDSKRVEVLDTSNGQNISSAVDAAFQELVEICLQSKLFGLLYGLDGRQDQWRTIMGLQYPVKVYRYAQPIFGFIGQGVHLTAYTHTQQGIKIWVPRRGATMNIAPRMLDNTAAGSKPTSLSVLEAMVTQANEEASLPQQYVRDTAKPVGIVTYVNLFGRGGREDEQDLIVPDVIYTYDLELPEDVICKPRPEHTWEIEEFYLLTVDEIKQKLLDGEFKSNAALVMIDFFVRHGLLTSDDPEYVDISTQLRRALPFKTSVRA